MIGTNLVCRAKVKGPEVWNAKTSAWVEGDFLGLGDATSRLVRMLRGYARLDWEKTNLILGLHIHPLYFLEMYPETISNSEGVMFDPFIYSSEARVTHKRDNFEIVFAIIKDFSVESAKRAVLPELFWKFSVFIKEHTFGCGVNYRVDIPRLKTDRGYKEDAHLSSVYPFVFALLKPGNFEFKLKFIYLENAANYFLLGAYGVTQRNPETDERFLTNMRTVVFWADLIYRGKKLEPGIFIGYSRNIGASDPIIKSYKGELGNDVSLLDVECAVTNAKYMFICMPRLRLKLGSFILGFEMEYFRASYARGYNEENWQDDFDDFGKVIRSRTVANTRFLFATRYEF